VHGEYFFAKDEKQYAFTYDKYFLYLEGGMDIRLFGQIGGIGE
jgi:hypothetical protein